MRQNKKFNYKSFKVLGKVSLRLVSTEKVSFNKQIENFLLFRNSIISFTMPVGFGGLEWISKVSFFVENCLKIYIF